jgi:16S rRNA (cytidine1402-2'-O)-methyltransferase
MPQGILYLVPVGLGAEDVSSLLPPATLETVRRITHFIAENPKTARAFFKAIGHPLALRELCVETLDEHTPAEHIPALLLPLRDGHDCGVLAEAGAPAVADPGALVVRAAHAAGIRVVSLVGPSAVLLALMSSGMNGQRFAFQGYLPVAAAERARRLIELESESARGGITQVFIEAPYRNDVLFAAILESCRTDTLLGLATDLTLPTEDVRTKRVSEWKKNRPALGRRPTVFLLYREGA